MRNFVIAFAVIAIIIGCSATKSTVQNLDKKQVAKNDTVRIANDSLEYEVIIIDSGFSNWLASIAKPRNYYSLTSMEIKNTLWVSEWNRRVLEPHRYDPNLYEMRIDYEPNIHYGYEVNYLIYNYFLYFQQQYRQKL